MEELLAQKMQEDEDFMARLKANYVANLKRHLDLDGTLEPTEGTVKAFSVYKLLFWIILEFIFLKGNWCFKLTSLVNF